MSISSRLAICETKNQVETLLSHPVLSPQITEYIATTADAARALQKNQIQFFSIENLQKNESPEFIEKLLNKQIRWAQNTDKILQDSVADFEISNFCPARYYLYYLKNTWDTFIHRADLLEKLNAHVSIEEVVYFSAGNQSTFDESLDIQASVMSTCIPYWAEFHHISQKPLAALKGDSIWTYRDDRRFNVKKIISKLPLPKQKIVKFLRGAKSFPAQFFNPACSLNELIIKQHYDITLEVCEFLQNSHFSLVYFEDIIDTFKKESVVSPKNLNSLLESTWDQVITEEWFWEFGDKPVSYLKNAMKPLFRTFWFKTIPQLWHHMNQSRMILDQRRPKAIVVGNIWGTKDLSLLMAARMKKVPVISYMHGANMGDVENTIWDTVDRYYSDYMLVYGPGEKNYIDNRPNHGDIHVKTMPVGSARLDSIRRRCSQKTGDLIKQRIIGKRSLPLVLYVPGVLFSNWKRYDYLDLGNVRLFEIRKQVAQLFNNQKDCFFVYKALVSQGPDPTLTMLSETCPSCKIIHDIPLSDLQWAADLLIHEIPSTGLHEGLLTNIPIIAYVDRDVYRMPDPVKKMLGKRVILAETGEDYLEEIRTALQFRTFTPLQYPDSEFLQQYLTYMNDGKSAIRAVSSIQDIVQNLQKK